MFFKITFFVVLFSIQLNAEMLSNTCKKDSDCVLLSTCNVLSASSKSIAEANNQYDLQNGVYYSKYFEKCDPMYLKIRESEGHDKFISKCVNKNCVLARKK